YNKSGFRRKNPEDENQENLPLSDFFYTLKFSYTFQNQGDRVLFSFQKPYTFADLVNFVEKMENILKKMQNSVDEFNQKTRSLTIITENIFYKKENVGGSRLGLAIYLIEISASKKIKQILPYDRRKIIFIIARQHPAETPSSLIVQGLIEYLLSDDIAAQKLREIFIFKIAPMINPDGVSVGNTRTNISGSDLNRQWDNPSESLDPEIFYLKQYMIKYCFRKEIYFFLDIHASSTQKNCFMFGCEQANVKSIHGKGYSLE
ncbi:zinc carboxypeptidase family protein, putative, partial [Ichthyophthirius multifiliis]